MFAAVVTLAALVQASNPAAYVVRDPGARSPAYSPDGRLALTLRGDIWVRLAGAAGAAAASADDAVGGEPAGADPARDEPARDDAVRSDRAPRMLRVTSGPAWDRDPAWAPDGAAIVFASDRAGGLDLWRVPVGPAGAAAEPERLTTDPAAEREPTVLADGSIIFVRGLGASADLWRLRPGGGEERVTRSPGAERVPAASPARMAVAYIRERDGRRTLAVLDLGTGEDTVVVADRSPDHPAWSPDGERIVFTGGSSSPGVWIAPADGRYVNLVSARRAEAAWSPDGRRLALVELPSEPPEYNGDPDRLGPAREADAFPAAGRLWFANAPDAPDASLSPAEVGAAVDRRERNAAAFDRVWARVADLYFAAPAARARRARWVRLRRRFRERAVAAADNAELERIIHEMLRARPPAREPASGRAAVSSAHPLATAAGLDALRRGGNVVDAAVAISFVLGVVEPDASGIGGYGQMVLHLRSLERPVAIDFLTRVPGAASLANGALLSDDGRLPPDGPVLVNVPGTVAGMWTAWTRYGSGGLSWAELIEPAIRIAEDGFEVSEGLATTLAVRHDPFFRHRGGRALFFPRGGPLESGDTLRNTDLAWTLRQIARHGPDAFYRGEVADRIVADLRAHGSPITREDLARYYAVERRPVRGEYRGHTVWSSAPAATGGATLVAKLNLLEHLEEPGLYRDDAATLHAMTEAWKLAPSTRDRIADPGLWPVRLEPFLSRDTADARWHCFDPERAAPAPRPGRGLPAGCEPDMVSIADGAAEPGGCTGEPASPRACRASGTTAFAVADADGDLVSVTQTLGTWGGSFYVTPGLGFLYNDKLRSYRTDPGAYNARLPYARNSTSISPTLVFRGTGDDAEPFLAVGAAGNAWIGAAVYEMIAAIVDGGVGPQTALELPRFLVRSETGLDGRRQPVLLVEDGFAPAAIRRLEALGHRVRPISLKGELRMGFGAAVMLRDGAAIAGADPRRAGRAGAVP